MAKICLPQPGGEEVDLPQTNIAGPSRARPQHQFPRRVCVVLAEQTCNHSRSRVFSSGCDLFFICVVFFWLYPTCVFAWTNWGETQHPFFHPKAQLVAIESCDLKLSPEASPSSLCLTWRKVQRGPFYFKGGNKGWGRLSTDEITHRLACLVSQMFEYYPFAPTCTVQHLNLFPFGAVTLSRCVSSREDVSHPFGWEICCDSLHALPKALLIPTWLYCLTKKKLMVWDKMKSRYKWSKIEQLHPRYIHDRFRLHLKCHLNWWRVTYRFGFGSRSFSSRWNGQASTTCTSSGVPREQLLGRLCSNSWSWT